MSSVGVSDAVHAGADDEAAERGATVGRGADQRLGELVSYESPPGSLPELAACADLLADRGEQVLGRPAQPGSPRRTAAPAVVRAGPATCCCSATSTRSGRPARSGTGRSPSTDGVATGPGVCDMKAGIVQMFAALRLLADTSRVGVLLTCDEETGLGHLAAPDRAGGPALRRRPGLRAEHARRRAEGRAQGRVGVPPHRPGPGRARRRGTAPRRQRHRRGRPPGARRAGLSRRRRRHERDADRADGRNHHQHGARDRDRLRRRTGLDPRRAGPGGPADPRAGAPAPRGDADRGRRGQPLPADARGRPPAAATWPGEAASGLGAGPAGRGARARAPPTPTSPERSACPRSTGSARSAAARTPAASTST